ncbi:P-loop containing nucleoside triphosphate hydrolase protein [Setomelanomma holmii]|uniref:P-loop containing nucleoside triphosphate hydrolase protein n=1 Tax=Setomelanomma holmii TaxID=210430 RepID=A0A9P4LJI5_9PLEO|nr:P-loop containing nucleoside triphosphate hydrolase protein [Setomelanomma holmii]
MTSAVEGVLVAHLQHPPDDDCPIVLITCGLAGAGKTTLVKAIRAAYPAFHRISIDEIVHRNHGIYGLDYEASSALYEEYNEEADLIYEATFRRLLAEKQDIICERSFYAKEDRDEFRKIAQEAGARAVLIFLKAEGEEGKELLWSRICKRSEGTKTANSAYDITRETFEMYWSGFENPDGEGEIVIEVK